MLIYLNHSCDIVQNEMVNAQGMSGKYIENFLTIEFLEQNVDGCGGEG